MKPAQEAWCLVDLYMGDSGKGTIVDFLARERNAHTVIRFNGGAQAAHHVVLPDGRMHRFAQFGSATFIPGVASHLTRFMVCSPWAMIKEEEHLRQVGVTDAFERTTLSKLALVITPFHEAANRLRERARGNARHGSCGIGVGETVKDSLELGSDFVVQAGDLSHPRLLAEKLERVRRFKFEQLTKEGVIDQIRHMRDAVEDLDVLWNPAFAQWAVEDLENLVSRLQIVADEYLGEILSRPGCVIFEPSQGVLLDEWRGFHPYTTWSTCTDHNMNLLLREHEYSGEVHRLGILRAYATRHGVGPFPTQDDELAQKIPDHHNGVGEWQGMFRIGHFDSVAAFYARGCLEEALDGLVITCLDRLAQVRQWKIATAYDLSRVQGEKGKYFYLDGQGRANDLKFGRYKDLQYQEGLTQAMLQARPIYQSCEGEEDLLGRIEYELLVPVVLTSHGPTREDKRWQTGGLANVA